MNFIIKIVLGIASTIPVAITIYIIRESFKLKLKSLKTKNRQRIFKLAYVLSFLIPVTVMATIDNWKFERDSLASYIFLILSLPMVVKILCLKEKKFDWKLDLTINSMGVAGILYCLAALVFRAFEIAGN